MYTKNKIPKKAKRVFKGVIFDVFQWQQKVYDGSVAPFEMLQRPDTAEVVAVVGNKILIQTEEQPGSGKFISLPCGRVNQNEPPQKAAARELLEETGYQATQMKLWRKNYPYPEKINWTVFTFIAKNCKKITKVNLDAGEKIKPRLITFDQFLNLANNPQFRTKSLQLILLRAKFIPSERKKLYKLLFGK